MLCCLIPFVIASCGVAEDLTDKLTDILTVEYDCQIEEIRVYFYDRDGETNRAFITYDKPYYIEKDTFHNWLYRFDGLAFDITSVTAECKDGAIISQVYTP